MAEQAALEALGLFKRYGERIAVDGVNVVVNAGEVHGLIGPNGAGKTTLLRMFLGLAVPDAGTVRLLGGTAGTAPGPALGGVAGFVDTPQFYPYLSGRRNLRLLARLDGAEQALGPKRVDELLDQVGLAAHANAKVGGYSAGMRQRLGLAAALLRSPRLLLLDEPTNSLDPAGSLELRAQVRRLASDGASVLLSSHDLAEVEDLCTRLTIVHHGRVVFSGTKAELRSQVPDAALRLHTSDDRRALEVGTAQPEVQVANAADGDGLDVKGIENAVDQYMLALGRAGIAVRSLEHGDRSLEALFLRLTRDAAEAGTPVSAGTSSITHREAPPAGRVSLRGVSAVVRVESTKLTAQLKAWAVLAASVAGPFAFVAAMKVQTTVPEDTLFGRWVKASGFAVPLVILGFAASWVFPVLTSVVGGDLLSAEDRYGTWPTLMTRSRSRGEIFAGKVLTALGFSVIAVLVLALSSAAAGLLVIGRQPLIGLSGNELPAGRALFLVATAWATVLPPVFAFTALALALSAATRSSAAGVGLPVLIGFLMELYSYVDGPNVVRKLLLTPPFVSWHGLFVEHPYYRPLALGMVTSSVYLVLGLAASYVLLRWQERWN
jgi:ABC-2 type transport system ATP-binding protein